MQGRREYNSITVQSSNQLQAESHFDFNHFTSRQTEEPKTNAPKCRRVLRVLPGRSVKHTHCQSENINPSSHTSCACICFVSAVCLSNAVSTLRWPPERDVTAFQFYVHTYWIPGIGNRHSVLATRCQKRSQYHRYECY